MSIRKLQAGASLIEVLVAILILSFGMLSLGAMLSFAVQAPKLSGYRAIATNLASSHIERMRANPAGFTLGTYSAATLSYTGNLNTISVTSCSYPDCTAASLATMDISSTQSAIRRDLPYGGLLVSCDTNPCTSGSYGNLWVIWQEPSTFAALNPVNSDNCPLAITGSFTDPAPRCLYVRFKV